MFKQIEHKTNLYASPLYKTTRIDVYLQNKLRSNDQNCILATPNFY